MTERANMFFILLLLSVLTAPLTQVCMKRWTHTHLNLELLIQHNILSDVDHWDRQWDNEHIYRDRYIALVTDTIKWTSYTVQLLAMLATAPTTAPKVPTMAWPAKGIPAAPDDINSVVSWRVCVFALLHK